MRDWKQTLDGSSAIDLFFVGGNLILLRLTYPYELENSGFVFLNNIMHITLIMIINPYHSSRYFMAVCSAWWKLYSNIDFFMRL